MCPSRMAAGAGSGQVLRGRGLRGRGFVCCFRACLGGPPRALPPPLLPASPPVPPPPPAFRRQVTDLRFVGPPSEPSHIAVSTNSEAVRLYSLASQSCAVSLVGHTDIVLCLDGGAPKAGEAAGGRGAGGD